MVTDTEKMEAIIDDPYILITDKKISSIQEILPLLEQIVKTGKKLVIIAEDVEGDALATLLVNRLRGNFTCVCVKAPGFGDRRKEMLKDIAILTGGTYISSELNMNLPDTQITDLGTARQVKVRKDNTVIVDGGGDPNAIKARVAEIKNTIGVTTSDYDKEKLQERLAKLSGGVAVIKVGAQTEVAMKEQKLRVEDALNATRAAVEEALWPAAARRMSTRFLPLKSWSQSCPATRRPARRSSQERCRLRSARSPRMPALTAPSSTTRSVPAARLAMATTPTPRPIAT